MSKSKKNNGNIRVNENGTFDEKLVLESRDPTELLMTNVSDAKKMMNARFDAKVTNLDKKRVVNEVNLESRE